VAVEVCFAPDAAADATAGFRWYEEQRPGLGSQFLDCVLACLERVRRSPELLARVRGEFRRALVRRFPYAVFYELVDQTVTVYGIVHTARDSAKWRSRLP
jgi:plasmid stabilization system protein ParE